MHLSCVTGVLLLGFTAVAVWAADQANSTIFLGKVSSLAIPAAELGDTWLGPTGLVVDDFDDTSEFPAEVQDLVNALKVQVADLGVVATADFTYRKKLSPLQQVTVRVFVFDSEMSCRAWWQKKYAYSGWEKSYSAVAGDKHGAVDSKEMSKRAVALGNVWLTSGTLGDSKEHAKAFDLYVKKIEAVARR